MLWRYTIPNPQIHTTFHHDQELASGIFPDIAWFAQPLRPHGGTDIRSLAVRARVTGVSSRELPARVYGGRSAADRRAERRERLLAAGLELIGNDGYAATSIEKLCA